MHIVKALGRSYAPPSEIKQNFFIKKLELDRLVICKNLFTIRIISRNENNDCSMGMSEKVKFTTISIFK